MFLLIILIYENNSEHTYLPVRKFFHGASSFQPGPYQMYGLNYTVYLSIMFKG
jgi:hypothetical protein